MTARIIAELSKLGLADRYRRSWPGISFPSDERARRRTSACSPSSRSHRGRRWACARCFAEPRGARSLLALVHHPLAVESGISRSKPKACAQRTIGTIRGTACRGHQRRNGAPVVVALRRPCGAHDRRAARLGSCSAGTATCGYTVRLLSVGAVVPRKGYDVLIAALATLADLPWSLTIAGDCTRNPKAAAQLKADIERHASTTAWPFSALCQRSSLANCMRRPISSSSPPALKAMAWPMPKRLRTACRSSEQMPAPFRAPFRRMPAYSSRRTMRLPLHPRCAA